MPKYDLRTDYYHSHITEFGVFNSSDIHELALYGIWSDRIEAGTPHDAMRAWSVKEGNELTYIKPGVWHAKYDLVTAAMRDYEVALAQKREEAKKAHSLKSHPTRIQQQNLI